MRKYKIDLLLNLLGLTIITIFFLPLFYPTLSLFVTPEVGVSDLWQFNIPVKLLMSQALHGGYVPLWTNTIGTGFPIFAESQMGFFNAFSLALYALFPHLVAFNLQFILIYFFTFSGMYIFLRHLKQSTAASFLGAFIWTFSGFFMTHISHQNMILAASYVPWTFVVVDLFFSTKKIRYLLAAILLTSQQLFAGYFQIAFITWIFIGLYGVVTVLFVKKNRGKRIALRTVVFGILVTATVLISAVQVLPTAELINHTQRKSGLSPAENVQHAYPFTQLVTLLDPFLMGSPKDGSYPHYNKIDDSIFWENTAYIGLLPLALAALALISIKKNKKVVVFLLLALTALFLMTGKHSPFYFIHTLPPFNRFRVPSRYILMFIFSLCVLSSIGFDELMKKLEKLRNGELVGSRRRARVPDSWKARILNVRSSVTASILVLFSVANIFYIWNGYHLIGKADTWFSDPETAAHIKNAKKPGRIYSLLGSYSWTDYFLKNGWDTDSNYIYFRNWLSPNYNILAGIDQYDAYVGKVNTNRHVAYSSLLLSNIYEPRMGMLHVATPSAKLLGLASVRYVIAPEKIDNAVLTKTFATRHNPKSLAAYRIYENTLFIPRAHIVYNYTVANTLESLQKTLISDDFDGRKTVVLEKELNRIVDKSCLDEERDCTSSIQILLDTDMHVKLRVTTSDAGLLVIADSYYPGWNARIDGKPTEIYAANINQRAVMVPAGSHTIEFKYTPESFSRGFTITIIGYIAIISLLLFEWRTAFLDRVFRTWRLFEHL